MRHLFILLIALAASALIFIGGTGLRGIYGAVYGYSDEYYDSELGSYTTSFNTKEKNRCHNIMLASDTIDGCIVYPGEIFSFNETLGPTSRRCGYKKSTIFIKGNKYEGYGGGVCQVSTTLYNAAVNAGMTIIERHDHSRKVPYAKKGEDAATSYVGIDFKFQNDLSFPVVIYSYIDDGTISITINEL